MGPSSRRLGRTARACSFYKRNRASPFEPPKLLLNVNSLENEWHPVISSDQLSLYFTTYRNQSISQGDIWMSSRPTLDDDFDEPHYVPRLNSTSEDSTGWLSVDQCVMYFMTDRDGPTRLYRASRPALKQNGGAN